MVQGNGADFMGAKAVSYDTRGDYAKLLEAIRNPWGEDRTARELIEYYLPNDGKSALNGFSAALKTVTEMSRFNGDQLLETSFKNWREIYREWAKEYWESRLNDFGNCGQLYNDLTTWYVKEDVYDLFERHLGKNVAKTELDVFNRFLAQATEGTSFMPEDYLGKTFHSWPSKIHMQAREFLRNRWGIT